MTPRLRKLALTVHLTCSVGWIGAVVAYLALVVVAMASRDAGILTAAWLAMEVIGRYAIVPLALGSLLTGAVIALATPWGLFRHYWVVISLGLTCLAVAVLLQHMQTVSVFAGMAAASGGADAALRAGLRGELLHAGIGLLILLTIEALNVYKPLGLTAYGRRMASQVASTVQASDRPGPATGRTSTAGAPRWVKIVGIHAVGLALLFVVMHLIGGGPRGH